MKTSLLLKRTLLLSLCLIFLLSLLFPLPAPVQAIAGVKVSGIVINQALGQPAPGIKVYLFYGALGGQPAYRTISLSNGTFTFLNIPPGFYVAVPMPTEGYMGAAKELAVSSTNINNFSLSLIKKFTLNSPPNGTVIETPNPKLCWEFVPIAASYQIQINRSDDWEQMENVASASNCYTMQAALENNTDYTWTILYALNAQGVEAGRSNEYWNFTFKSGPKVIDISPSAATFFTSLDGTITFTFPSGSFSEQGTITYEHDASSPENPTMSATGKAYTLTSSVPLVANAQYQVTISYSRYDLGTIDPNTLALYYWDDTAGQWVKEPTSTVDLANNLITARPNHLSRWAVFGNTHLIYIPFAGR